MNASTVAHLHLVIVAASLWCDGSSLHQLREIVPDVKSALHVKALRRRGLPEEDLLEHDIKSSVYSIVIVARSTPFAGTLSRWRKIIVFMLPCGHSAREVPSRSNRIMHAFVVPTLLVLLDLIAFPKPNCQATCLIQAPTMLFKIHMSHISSAVILF